MRDVLFFALVFIACPLHALTGAWMAEATVALAIVLHAMISMLLVIGCAAYACGGGHHAAWGLLGLLNVVGMFLLLFVVGGARGDGTASRGFEVVPLTGDSAGPLAPRPRGAERARRE